MLAAAQLAIITPKWETLIYKMLIFRANALMRDRLISASIVDHTYANAQESTRTYTDKCDGNFAPRPYRSARVRTVTNTSAVLPDWSDTTADLDRASSNELCGCRVTAKVKRPPPERPTARTLRNGVTRSTRQLLLTAANYPARMKPWLDGEHCVGRREKMHEHVRALPTHWTGALKAGLDSAALGIPLQS